MTEKEKVASIRKFRKRISFLEKMPAVVNHAWDHGEFELLENLEKEHTVKSFTELLIQLSDFLSQEQWKLLNELVPGDQKKVWANFCNTKCQFECQWNENVLHFVKGQQNFSKF